MKNNTNKTYSPNLRQKAEEILKKKSSKSVSQLSETENLKLIHELEVHQIELEMQNEELVLAKEKADLAKEKYSNLYDFAPSGYLTLSKEDEIIELNFCAAQVLGRDRSHLLKSSFASFVSFNTRFVFNHFLEKVFTSPAKESCELILTTEGNLPKFIHIDGIIGNNDEHCLITVVDITERKQAQQLQKDNEELIIAKEKAEISEKISREYSKELIKAKEKAEESDKFKTAFINNMSHEIRTPMNAIIGFSTMLGKAGLTAEKQKRFTEIIINNSNQLMSIVKEVLTISSIQTKQEKITIQKVCMNNIIEDLNEVFKIQASDKKISIYAKHPLNDKQSEIYTDKTKITQILTNLLTNAIKYTHKGFVEFGYAVVETLIQFYVKDTGIGIPLEIQQKIFERFRQAETGLSRHYGGTGLGLSISKGFVELLGGKIWVESKPEKGSTFYFSLPYKKESESDKLNPPIEQPERGF
jgi:signal transduction histidine kinase